MEVNVTKEFLKKRVEYLEEVNRKVTSSLEVVKSLAQFQNQVTNRYDSQIIFSESTEKILEIIDFKSIAFLLYDIQNYEFNLAHVYPQFLKGDFLVEVDNQIENGSFAWAIAQKKAVYVNPLKLDDDSELILHVLSTDKMVLGMFFGQLNVPKEDVFNESLELLTVALNTTSFAIENYKLYTEVELYNKELEKKVGEKTADILEINEKLKYEIEVRKTAERELNTHKVYFESLFRSSPVAVVSLDNSKDIILANPKFLTLFGFDPEEIIGRNIDELILPEGVVNQNNDEELGYGVEQTIRKRKDGSIIDVAISRSPLVMGKANVGVLAIYEDITERKAYEKDLKRTKELAVQATESKTEFLTNMSHEIRTPLNAILGMCELVMETELNREQKEYIEVVRASSDGLFSLVNDILDFSRIESGSAKLDYVEFDLEDLVEGVADIFSIQCEKKGLELLYNISMGTPLKLLGDETRIRQILINLVANAVKFTNEGYVCIKVESGKITKNNQAQIKLTVEDSGIGIDKIHQQKIFELFSLADNSSSRKYGGTGLGLNIVQALTKLMGGRFSLKSEMGEGCRFTVYLDLPATTGSVKTPLLNGASGISLIVDKYTKSRKILSKKLKSQNIKVLESAAGKDPIKIIKSNPDIVCAIINCANSSDVVGKIKNEPELKHIKIILIVSKTGLNNLENLKDGMWLTKPVKDNQLFAAIDQVNKDLEGYKKILDTSAEQETQKQTNRKILLVEDNLQNQKILRKMLKLGGYDVTVVENGKEAVKVVGENVFHAILMDIQMPIMDGFEATEQIRKNEKEGNKRKVPIIALTAHAIVDYKNKCLSSGMDDYMTKPVKKQILLDKIEAWARRVTIAD